ncbi:transposase [Cohnella thailandensis]|uniref:Transposase n=1 Tax=Cohnella thailandensis TaxID=557557 RepID=A0A841T6D4_9BACL|nr:transposase [Cohnella thailandensis]MBB6638255.1 transposase [Cohnella thailandensis]MBP1977677.1 Flp pilus assembly protein TadB [Cohnella thailandensis]
MKDPTIYHYKLIRKLTLLPEMKYAYLAAALMGIAALTILDAWRGLLYSLLGLSVMFAVHAIVLKITLRRVEEPAEKKWFLRFDLPWIGPLPVSDTSLSLFRRLHLHLLLVGCCVAGLFYPWTSSSLVVALIFWHVWLLAPRFFLLLRTRKELSDGVIRLEGSEISYYHR